VPKRNGFEHGVPAWVDLSTSDVEAAKTFYAKLFGWQWTAADMPTGTYWMATLQGELVAGLSAQQPDMAAQGVSSTWNTYVNVDNVDDATARAQAAGGQVLMQPIDIADTGRMSFISDPSGAPIGMWQAGTHKGAGLVNEPGALIWNEVYAPDTQATVAFYHQVFGWGTGGLPFGEGSTYTTFKVGDAIVGGTAPPAPHQLPPHWQVWFGTADADATAATAIAQGASIDIPPTDSPMGKIAFIRDPTGAVFSVITADQAS
jgi:predicted enzyme related to lactoylglutathione lyase